MTTVGTFSRIGRRKKESAMGCSPEVFRSRVKRGKVTLNGYPGAVQRMTAPSPFKTFAKQPSMSVNIRDKPSVGANLTEL